MYLHVHCHACQTTCFRLKTLLQLSLDKLNIINFYNLQTSFYISNSNSWSFAPIWCIPIKIHKIPDLFQPIEPNGFDQIILTTIGRYTEYKGYENIIKLVSNNQKYKLNIISNSDFPSKINNLVNLSNNVEILRDLDDIEMNYVLKKSHVFILSSITRSEGFGIVLLEALRLGLPICVNKLKDTGSEFITIPGFNGEFFDIRDNSSLFIALDKICNPSSYYKYSNGALEDFNSRFCLTEKKEFLSILKK